MFSKRIRLFLTVAALGGVLVIAILAFGRAGPHAKESVLDRKVVPAGHLPNGFVVWSSNRAGNHDIYKMTLPEKRITRITNHPHTEYYPRISPDGKLLVFSRSRQKQVSQRDPVPWDVILLDLETGKETLLAEFGNTPTWSWDGRRVFFQRKVTEFVEHDIESGKEKIIFQSGRGKVLPGAGLQTPHFAPDHKYVAVTLRYKQHLVGVVDLKGALLLPIADGCQLTWSRRGDFLYFVDHGGRMDNAFYIYEWGRPKPVMWLDMPGEFSHEYFPKLSNDEQYLVFGASRSAQEHEHDQAD